MNVEKVKYIIWAADMNRAVAFYRDAFGGEVTLETEGWSEVVVAGATIGLHGGGEGKRTWTGLSFRVDKILPAIEELVAAGGELTKEPTVDEGDEEPHLAMCVDSEGNEFMLTQKRS